MRFLGIAAATFYAAFVWRSGERYAGGDLRFVLFDDAMISMRYARNLADGFGLVWNPGGEAVEGFTNLLWTLLMVPPHLAPLSDAKTSLVVMLTGCVLLLANAFVVLALTRRLGLRSPAAGMASAASVAFLFPLVFWTLRGMEVGLLALCVDWGALRVADLAAERERGGDAEGLGLLGALLCVGVFTRPDFLVPGAVLVAGAAFAVAPSRRGRSFAGLVACLLGSALALTAFRWAYYGELLPNTYYLKVVGHGLAERIARGGGALWDTFLHQLWPIALLLALATRHPRFRRPLPILLLCIGLSQCAYSVYVGGDAWEGFHFANRFVTLGLPALLVVAALGIDQLAAWLRVDALPARAQRGGVLALGVALAWLPVNLQDVRVWVESGAPGVVSDHRMAGIGSNIRDLTPEDTVIAVIWAGSIPYFARRTAVDLLGKTDPVVARSTPIIPLGVPGHTKYLPSYSIEKLRPDLIVQAFLPDQEAMDWLRGLGYEEVPPQLGRFAKAELAAELRRVVGMPSAPGARGGPRRRGRDR